MTVATLYSREFYKSHEYRSDQAARVIVPLVVDLVRPQSVVDVGCGTGGWLWHFQECGVEEVHGIDGQWIDPALLKIPGDLFEVADISRPLANPRMYDLVVSLEVAEHLPPSAADQFVRTLTSLGRVVLFSAAIPRQGGTGHLNEQWPEYWAARFESRGYIPIDCLRWKLWHRSDLAVWYIQNILFYVDRTALANFPALEAQTGSQVFPPLDIVHPRQYLASTDRSQHPFRTLTAGLRRRLARIPTRLRRDL